MSKVDFKINLPGINEMMKSAGIQSALTEAGARVLSNAISMSQEPEAEYGMSTKTINWIAVTNVRAENGAALRENYENNILLKALR